MIRVRQIKIDAKSKDKNILLNAAASKLNIKASNIKDYKIVKESIDARDKNQIFLTYELDLDIDNIDEVLRKNKSSDVFLSPDLEYKFKKIGTKEIIGKPVIVGSGPAGLMCAYILASNGYKPLIVERGSDIEKRTKDVELFWETGKLDPESNVQFGLGGAGTFSDGKLNTLTKDTNNRRRKFLNTFYECGADEDILYSYKPHVGTDVLHTVVDNLKNKIISLGGEFLFDSKFIDFDKKDDELYKIVVNNKEIETNVLILAIGNSARDTYRMLLKKGVNMEAKPFAVGLRCEHLQSDIDEAQYGKYAKLLHPATYKLTYQSKDKKGVYSFCMCPGGYVINASSEENKLVVNGMSYKDRNSINANSAIIVTVNEKDYGNNILDGLKYQEVLEYKAYKYANGLIPIQKLIDFKNNKKTEELGKVIPSLKGKYTYANLNDILPLNIASSIKEAFTDYGKKINGFDHDDVILSGVETRSSSPVRILRDENYETNIKGIYAIGEGSGYTGGITTSAVDGIKMAEIIGMIYK